MDKTCEVKNCKFATTCPPDKFYTYPACGRTWCDQHKFDATYRKKYFVKEKHFHITGKYITLYKSAYCSVCGGPLCRYCVSKSLFGKARCKKCGRPVIPNF